VSRPTSSLPFDFTAKPVVRESEPPRPAPAGPVVLTVGDLGRAVKRALDGSFAAVVSVEGEVTGARPAASGHVYFGLKDEREEAAIDVVIYKTNLTPRMRAMIVDGARVRLRGKPTFWAPRGRLQFVCDRVEPAGRGALLEALEKLKAKLAAEGLFAAEAKRPIPAEPRVIGVVTSRTGAVIHDICKVAFRRGGARVLLANAAVQGAGAPAAICRALAALSRLSSVDVIIVGRGGGSSDDLSAFNDEDVVRAVAACRVPVISAVGHEVDVTLTDFAADARAATPSQAAEMVVPDARARRSTLAHWQARLERAARARVNDAARQLQTTRARLGDPRLVLAGYQQTHDDRRARLEAAAVRPIGARRAALVQLDRRLTRLHPSVRLAQEARTLASLEGRMAASMRRRLGKHQETTRSLAAGLDAMSPLRVLARGYAIATTDDGRAVRDAGETHVGDVIEVRVARGRLGAKVVRVEPEK